MCCNIFSAISLFFTGTIIYCIKPETRLDKSYNFKNGFNVLCQLICYGTSVWGLVTYFEEWFIGKLINPFKNVLLVEMIYFFSVIGFLVIGICTTCSYLCIKKTLVILLIINP
jgi:hypothetical protein